MHNSKPGCNIHTKDFLKCGLVSFVFDCGDDDYLINGVESGVRGVVEYGSRVGRFPLLIYDFYGGPQIIHCITLR